MAQAASPSIILNKEHILREIKRTAEANGGVPLGKHRFLRETGIKESDWLGKFWARWGDAVREAGYAPNQLQIPYHDTFLLEKYISLVRELGRIPAQGDMRLKSSRDGFPNEKTFDRFGSKPELVKRLMVYCEGRDGYGDVVSICGQFAPAGKVPREASPADGEIGFVYLMKSGKVYKIGRSNAAGRREYELGIQLPEKLKSVHVIRTDDPVGIEAYWHKRFEVKRKNGEWFGLDASDVSAFKRRKFM